MRLLLALIPAVALLAGCATNPSPVGDAEAAHAGIACPAGTFVGGFTAAGSPQCAAPSLSSFSCPKGEVMVGFDTAGAPLCKGIMAVAEESMREQQASQPSRPARSLSLTSNSALKDGVKGYTIASATPGMTWGDLAITVDGAPRTLDAAGTCPRTPSGPGTYLVCGPSRETEDSGVHAGDTLTVSGIASGATLRVLDAQANSVILTLVVG